MLNGAKCSTPVQTTREERAREFGIRHSAPPWPGLTTTREHLEQLVTAIADQRRKLQFATDGLWPRGKLETIARRREFGLPPDKAFKG